MRLGGVLQAAAEVLAETDAGNRSASDILKNWGKAHRFAGVNDRTRIGNIVYDALRRRLSLGYKIASNAPQDLAYAAVLAQDRYDTENLEAVLSNDKFAPPPLSQKQKTAWQEANIKTAAEYVQADIPEWVVTSLQKTFGENWQAEAQALKERPPLDLRVNGLKATREKVLKQFAAHAAYPVPLTPWALRIAAPEGDARLPNVQTAAAFQQGLFEVQDCGSQMAARLCSAKAGEQILDYCAGGGGKTLALAADMKNRGQIHAYDSDKKRLAPLSERARRAGARNVQIYNKAKSLEPLAGMMDCVLLDAPCSGSGTWRRHPEAKWRLTEENLQIRLAEQQTVLAAGARFVKPGGRLVYVTCSLLYEENDAQIARFLSENNGFRLKNMHAAWVAAVPAAAIVNAVAADNGTVGSLKREEMLPHFTPYGLLLSPKQTATDGFFISILEKTA